MRASLVSASRSKLETLLSLLADAHVGEPWIIKNVAGDGLIFESAPDVVIGILNPGGEAELSGSQEGFNNFDVLLRVGQAVARNIACLLIVPPPLKPPSWIKGLSVALCSTENRSALADHIWALTNSVEKGASSVESPPAFVPFIDAAHYLSRLESVGKTHSKLISLSVTPRSSSMHAHAEFESLVSEVLTSAGAALAEGFTRDTRGTRGAHGDYVDFAFTPSSDSSVVVLAECKFASRKRRLEDDEAILHQKVVATHSQLGLLIYHSIDDSDPHPPRHTTALVERISASELIRSLGSNSLKKVIADSVARAATRH
jgi:hypothetical protein